MQGNTRFEYTLNVQALFKEKTSKLKSYYCREDFERVLGEVDRASKDARLFRLKDLKTLCSARGFTTDELLHDRTLLEQIPTRGQLQEDLLDAFYDLYKQLPKTTAVMERIVRRLAPEYRDDTVRTAILKKFLMGAGKNFKRFSTEYPLTRAKERLSEEERALMPSLTEKEQMELLISKVDDSFFEDLSAGLSDRAVFLLIARLMVKYRDDEALAFEHLKLRPQTAKGLDDILKQYGHTEPLLSQDDKVLRIAELLEQNAILPDRVPGFSQLATDLEDDFRAQLKTVTRVSRTGKESNAAALYKEAKKDAADAAKEGTRLLELCRDLAAGSFRVNGKTKVQLYYFAFMFGMTVPLEGKPYDPERDIVKNLFQDYYNDNLLRLLEGDYADPDMASAVENEPTGEGINYKNFVEAVYLYFLCHDELDMTPGEKIDAAEAVIDKAIRLARKAKTPAASSVSEYTEFYKEHYINVLLNKEIRELPDYIAENFLVSVPDPAGTTRIMFASEENTAFDLVGETLEDLADAYPDMALLDIRPGNDLTQEEMRQEMSFRENPLLDWKIKTLLEERFSEDADFLKVLSALDDRVHIRSGRFHKASRERMITLLHVLAREKAPVSMYILHKRLENKGVTAVGAQLSNALQVLGDIGFAIVRNGDLYYLAERTYDDEDLNEMLRKVDVLYLPDMKNLDLLMEDLLISHLKNNKRITRNELIALHFHYYITLLSDTAEGLDTFPDIFEDYDATISPILEMARFQPLSEKNLFDMFVVTMLYFYLVENNG